jgi:hypothetical protein
MATLTFTNIADTRGSFGGPFAPDINGAGLVVFEDDTGEEIDGQRVTKIFTSDGITTTTIAATGDTGDFLTTPGDFLNFFGGPVINNKETVAFFSGLQLGGTGIFTGDGETITTIADESGPVSPAGSEISINNEGTVAF